MTTVVVLSTDELRALVRDAVVEALRQQAPAAGGSGGKGWLRASEAAALADVSRSTIAAWIVDGTIPEAALLRCGRTHRIAAWWLNGRRIAS